MDKMILRSSSASPFGRKVKIAASLLGLMDRVAVVAADPRDEKDSLRQQNPLGKIPVLILADGTALYDSRVIVEYLDELAGGGRIIPAGPARYKILTRQALADGILDAAILQIYEVRFRPPEARAQNWLDYQAQKVARGLNALEADLQPVAAGCPTIADITIACMLGYLDFRFAGDWRKDHPRLVAWLDRFSEHVPSFHATRPH